MSEATAYANRLAEKATAETLAASIAASMWLGFTTSEKNLVRFGMFPAEKMAKAEVEMINAEVPRRDVARLLAVALMDCAKRDGGMCA